MSVNLETQAPIKREKNPFAKVRLNSAARAFAALNCQKAMVRVWLVHRVWLRQCPTVAVPNGELVKLGVSPDAKVRALRQLEAAGLVMIDWRPRKTPLVTML